MFACAELLPLRMRTCLVCGRRRHCAALLEVLRRRRLHWDAAFVSGLRATICRSSLVRRFLLRHRSVLLGRRRVVAGYRKAERKGQSAGSTKSGHVLHLHTE